MIKINKKIEYALIILKHIALKQADELSTAREISDLYRTPFDTTAKIMQRLNKAKILHSNQGVNGGYHLTQNLKDLNYVQLSEVVENKNFDFNCEGPKGMCDLYEGCNIKSPVTALNQQLKLFFKNISLHELLMIDQQSKENREHL